MTASLSVIKWKFSLSILIFESGNPTGRTADEKNTHFMLQNFKESSCWV